MSDFGTIVTGPGFVVDFAAGRATLGDGSVLPLGGATGAFITGPQGQFANDGTVLGSDAANEIGLNTRNTTLASGAGDDVITVTGSQGHSLSTGTGDDMIFLRSGVGDTTVEGGAGTDTLHFSEPQVFLRFVQDDSLGAQGLTITGLLSGSVYTVSGVETFTFPGPIVAGAATTVSQSFEDLPFTTTLTGSAAGDLLIGTDNDNRINGLGGNDWIQPGLGRDTVDGGDGIDTVSYVGLAAVSVSLAHQSATIGGSVRQELINLENVTGTSFADSLSGNRGDNLLRGLGGRDTIFASVGADTLDGGAGTDVLRAGSFFFDGPDQHVSLLRGRGFAGDTANDVLLNFEHVTTGRANDQLTGDHGANRLDAGYGDDTLMGNGGDDLLYGGFGTDVALFGYAQEHYTITQIRPNLIEVAYTGPGAGDGTDLLADIEVLRFADVDVSASTQQVLERRTTGTAGDDTLSASAEPDAIRALDGNDLITMSPGGGADTVNGGTGRDTVSYQTAPGPISVQGYDVAHVSGPGGTDRLESVESIVGTGAADTFHIHGAREYIGDLGDDVFFVYRSQGDYQAQGGGGRDTLSFATLFDDQSATELGVYVSGDRTFFTPNSGSGARFTSIETIIGSSYADRLTGTNNAETLSGGFGNDTLMGNNGNDLLVGGEGIDVAIYNRGRDEYTISTTGANTTVAHTGGGMGDATDLLTGIEVLRFTDGDVIL